MVENSNVESLVVMVVMYEQIISRMDVESCVVMEVSIGVEETSFHTNHSSAMVGVKDSHWDCFVVKTSRVVEDLNSN